MLAKIAEEVRTLLSQDNTGHGVEHVERVCKLAQSLAQQENANREVVELASLLHDVDDYKLFGAENAENLSNAKKIMQKYAVAPDVAAQVCQIISSMGYSKSLQGIRPETLEGKIVSDADMLDAIGALGTVRCLTYALARCDTPIFDKNIFPDLGLSAEEYKKPNRQSDNFINHFFEKLLKIESLLFTQAAKKEAQLRQQFMIDFLKEFFRENGCANWLEYLDDFLKNKS